MEAVGNIFTYKTLIGYIGLYQVKNIVYRNVNCNVGT